MDEDFSEIIKREEEESGVRISTSHSVRTSLEEKYRKVAISQDAVTAALYNGIQPKDKSQEQLNLSMNNGNSTMVRNTFFVECMFYDMYIV